MKISQKLKIIKKLSGLTQEKLAKECGVSFVTLNSWINNKSIPYKKHQILIDELYKKYTGENIIPDTELEAKKRIITKRSKKYKNIIQTIKSKKDLYDDIVIKLTYNSNSIEGSTLTENDTALILNKDITLPNKRMVEHLEAKNHQTALNFLFDHVKKDFIITEKFILKLHSILMNGILDNSGLYRNHGVRIAGSNVPTANYLVVPDLIKKIIKKINKKEKNLILHISEVHAEFEKIHPFSDGNGRIDRLLMIAMLLRKNIAPVLIRQENKQFYYTYLNKAQLEDKFSLLEDFLCDSIIEMYDLIETSY